MKRLILPLLLVVEIVILAPLSLHFDSWNIFWESFGWYLRDLLIDAAPILVLSFGMTAILASGGIDLSVGSMTALVACVLSTFKTGDQFWLTAIPVGLAVGAGLGLFNGLLVAALDVPPIIATLGTLFFYRGLCDAVLKGTKPNPFFDVPGYAQLGELNGTLAVVGCILILGGGWYQRSRWRREIRMIGGNRVAARYAAIPVNRRLMELYTLSGILAFVAAVCFTAHNGSTDAEFYRGLELQVIVAVVLGGTSVIGGSETVLGSVIGVLLVAVLEDGLRAGSGASWIQQHLPFKISHLRYVFLGVLLAGGVWINTHFGSSRDRSGR